MRNYLFYPFQDSNLDDVPPHADDHEADANIEL